MSSQGRKFVRPHHLVYTLLSGYHFVRVEPTTHRQQFRCAAGVVSMFFISQTGKAGLGSVTGRAAAQKSGGSSLLTVEFVVPSPLSERQTNKRRSQRVVHRSDTRLWWCANRLLELFCFSQGDSDNLIRTSCGTCLHMPHTISSYWDDTHMYLFFVSVAPRSVPVMLSYTQGLPAARPP